MPQGMQDLPPPVIEWRPESYDERRQRLMRSGVLPVTQSEASAAVSGAPVNQTPARGNFIDEIDSLRKDAAASSVYWFAVDAARWRSIKSPRGTKTVSNGSFGLSLEITRRNWRWHGAQFGFGPQALFYHGGQFGALSRSLFQGNGYADFSSTEAGVFVNIVRRQDSLTSRWQKLFAASVFYLPVRWISAHSKSSGNMITRSDTHSRVALSLPGLGARVGGGTEWGQFVRGEIFYSIQGAWPIQLRSRVGLQISMGLSVKENTLPNQ